MKVAALFAFLLASGVRALAVDVAADARAYPLRGEIVGVRPARQTLLVHHEEIPGFMPAMTMEFAAPGSNFAGFKAGQHITARLRETAPGRLVLDEVRVIDVAQEALVTASARALRQRMLERPTRPSLGEGEIAPNFALYDQDGTVVAFERFRGRRVVLNFIYTRCPVADMCPAATARMAALQRLARQRSITDLELISITLDPAYDTPAVLKAYAAAHGIDTAHFTFLTGPEGAIRDLLAQFRIVALPSENLWNHSLATSVIDPDGRLVRHIEGDVWEPAELLNSL
jgi:protein SCO1/2